MLHENKSDEIKRSGLEGRRILLVEDQALNAEIAKRILKRAGCEVTWAENGQKAVLLFGESAPGTFQAILMDIRMPIMNGIEATRAIRALNRVDAKEIPIIAMTANAYEEDIKKSLAAGMNDHLAKPIDQKKLFSSLTHYINLMPVHFGAEELYLKYPNVEIDKLKNMIKSAYQNKGAFTVEYDSFDDIYNFLERNQIRMSKDIQMLLFSIKPDDKYDKKTVEAAYRELAASVQFSLRSGDLLMKFNEYQIAALLVNCDAENGRKVADRILSSYHRDGTVKDIMASYEMSGITTEL